MKTVRSRSWGRALAILLTLSGACSATSADPAWLVALDGDSRFDTVEVASGYDYEVLNERLARGPELVALLGFDRVESDLQAAYAIRASYAISHSAFDDTFEEQDALTARHIADGSLEGVDPELDVALEPLEIINGTATNSTRELVQLSFPSSQTACSGVVVSSRVILTAAHCLTQPALLGPTAIQGTRLNPVSVRRQNADGTTTTVFSSAGLSFVYLARHFAYAGTGDVANDIGIIVLPTPMSTATRGRFFATQSPTRRADELFSTYRIRGWGSINEEPAAPNLQRRVATVDARTPAFFSHNVVEAGVRSTNAATCRGDSGGAWTRTTGGRTITFGIHSSGGPKIGRCGDPWTTMSGTATAPKIGWMITEAAAGGSVLQCRRYQTSTGVRYYRCS